MNKLFTFAFVAAFSTNIVEAQVLKYGAEAGETAPDTVNWYGNWVDAGGKIEFGNQDAATGDGSIYVKTPETAGAAQDWERVLKFDGLQIKPNTNYRVRVSAKAPADAVIGLALMCGDENCDMPFVLPTENGYYSQKKDVNGFNEADFMTKSAMFRYTTDEYQQEIYPRVKADDPNPLGDNRFLRLTVKSTGEYFIDDVIVEEAPIASCYFGWEAIKVDFGFNTNIAALVKANGGVISLDPSCAKVTVDGDEVVVEAVELHADGNLYIFPEEMLDETSVITVSFDASESGILYAGSQTPGDGIAVPSFENENTYFDETIQEASVIYEGPKLVKADPADGSFELDENIQEFSFTFDKDIIISGDKAPVAVLSGGVIAKPVKLAVKESESEFGKTVTFVYDGAVLRKGQYKLTVTDILSSKEIEAFNDVVVMFETGKVAVAEIEYTDVEVIDVQGDNGNASTNWTSYFNDEEFVAAGGGIRMFDFPASGKYTKGFYLSQRDADERGTALSYGEKEDAPFTLPAGDVQINILASAWQGNSGNFLYELINEAGEVVATGNGNAEIHIPDQGTAANEVSKISFNVEKCKAGNYVLRLSTKSGGYGNAIIVWGLDIKTYAVGQGETADNQLAVDGSFAGVGNDCAPDEGSGWTIYELRNGEPTAIEKGSSTAIGQRARFFAYSNVPNLPVAYYNRNMGGVAETSYYMTYGEEAAGEPALELDEARYNFSWYCVNWKGENNKYYFKILDAETGAEVYSREDDITVMVNGNRDTKVEPTKIEFAWTPEHAGKYILKWFMDGESSLGNIKVEKMGSLAVYWHTQLNNALAVAEEELANAAGDEFAGATRDALAAAIEEAKTVTYHTGEEYTAAMERLEQFVKDMAARRGAIADYNSAYSNLEGQIASMEGSKYEKLDSYKQAAKYVEKYAGVEGYTIENEDLLPLVSDMQTLYTLNVNLMANGTGVAVLTDQINKLVQAYNKLDAFNSEVDSESFDANAFELVISAEDAVTDDQELAATLKKLVTSALYKAINNGYKFEELEFPEDEPSEDNQYVPTALDLSGFIRNSVFYTTTAKNQPETQAQADGTCPGWEFNAPNGYAADWGWGGWSGNNQPVAPLNITNSQAGTRWGTSFEVFQSLAELPVGIYSIGGDCCDRSFVGSDNVLDPAATTPSYIYVKQAGQDELQKPFNVDNIGQYYGMTETLIEGVTIEPVEDSNTGKVTLGAQVIFFGPEGTEAVAQRDGFASFDNAKLKMSAKHPTFDYAAAAKEIDDEIATGIQKAENTLAGTPVKTQYFDLNGRKVANAKGILLRIDTMEDGSQRTSKVLRR